MAPFLPSPLVMLLASEGFKSKAERGGSGEWIIYFLARHRVELLRGPIARRIQTHCPGQFPALFTGLPSADLETIADLAIPKSLEKGEYPFREGDPSHGFYLAQRGAINVHRVNALGKEQIIHVFRVGEPFAEATLATDKGYPGDARSVEPSRVLPVQKDGRIALLKRRPDLALQMLASMSAHLRVLVGQPDDLTLKDLETRLANWLLKKCSDPQSAAPVAIQLTVTKRVLAAELGTVSKTLSRTLAKFREQGLIAVNGRTITVISPGKLSDLLEQHLRHGI